MFGNTNLVNSNSNFSYEYEIRIKMASSTSGLNSLLTPKSEVIVIKANNVFGNFTQRINTADKVWFKGILRNSLSSITHKQTDGSINNFINLNKHQKQDANMRLGRKYPLIELYSIGCIECADKELTEVTSKDNFKMNDRMKDLLRGLKYFLNVILNPLVIVK